MIRIKDNIINENKIIQISINEDNNLEIDVDNSFPRVIKNANFSDIEWNYDKEIIRKALDNDIDLRIKIQELEEENETLKKEYLSLNKKCEKLEENKKKLKIKNNELISLYQNASIKINKAIEYIENNKQILIFADLRKDGTNQYTIECDVDDLLDILKGEKK